MTDFLFLMGFMFLMTTIPMLASEPSSNKNDRPALICAGVGLLFLIIAVIVTIC